MAYRGRLICRACLSREASASHTVTIERLDVADDELGPATVRSEPGRLEPRYRWERWVLGLCGPCDAALSSGDPNGQLGMLIRDRQERWYSGHRVGRF